MLCLDTILVGSPRQVLIENFNNGNAMGCTEDAILAGFVLCVITLAIRYTKLYFIFRPVLFWYHKSKAVSFLFIGSSMGLSYLVWSSIAAARSDENCKVPILIFVFCICDCVCICTSVSNSRHPPFVRHIHCDISHIDLVIQNIQYVQKMYDVIHNECSMYQSMPCQLSHRPIKKCFIWVETNEHIYLIGCNDKTTDKLQRSGTTPRSFVGKSTHYSLCSGQLFAGK